jgi:uncharacterized protein
MSGEWIQTWSGDVFNFDESIEDRINILDIAAALAKICRFNGHCLDLYTVAQHSVMVATRMPPRLGKQAALFALLHDAHEAFLGDDTRPKKLHLGRIGPEVKELEERIQRRIHAALGLPPGPGLYTAKAIREIDDRMLVTEKRDLMAPGRREWDLPVEPYPEKIHVWPWQQAQEVFLRTFERLNG